MALAEVRSRRVPLPFVGGAYETSSKTISAMGAVNCYAEAGQDASSQISLRGVPGASQVGSLTDIRALDKAFGQLYVVAGGMAYRIDRNGVETLLGSVIDDGKPASIAYNIFEVTIVSGGAWYTVQKDTDVFSRTDVVPVSHANFIDGYIMALEIGTGRFLWSGINDADDVSGLDFATAEGMPDDNIGLIVDHREVFLFGEDSLERWYNDGVTPFARLPNGFIERGCGAGYSPAKIDNTVCWLGDDLTVYRLTEGRPQRISNHGIEQLIARTANPSDAVGLTYSQDGHAFYQLTFPGELTITYDASTGLLHTRKLYTRKDCGYSHHAYVHGKHYVGGAKLWVFDDSLTFDGVLERIRTIGPIRTGKRFASMYSLGLLFETGSSDSYIDPKQIFLEISDDGGRTFSNRRQAVIGSKAQYTQEVKFNGLGGMFDNQRVLRLTLTDAARFNLVEAYADIG